MEPGVGLGSPLMTEGPRIKLEVPVLRLQTYKICETGCFHAKLR